MHIFVNLVQISEIFQTNFCRFVGIALYVQCRNIVDIETVTMLSFNPILCFKDVLILDSVKTLLSKEESI